MFDSYNAASGGTDTMGFLDFGFEDFGNPNGGHGIDWQSIINAGFSIGSQAIGAWGHNPTQQINVGGFPVGQGYSPQAILQAQAANTAAQNAALYAQQHGGAGAGGVGLDDAATSITSFITRNPLLVAGGVLGLFLLMREPPRRR